jgi:AbrB family looped-hinge helix DNA binding protein
MFSKITDKFQITIPKEIRIKFKLKRNDSIEWIFDAGKIYIRPGEKDFLKYRGSISVGSGDIDKDITKAKKIRSGMINE